MTLRDTFFTRSEISRLAGWLVAGSDMDLDVELPPPCMLKVNNQNSRVFISFLNWVLNFIICLVASSLVEW